MKGKSVSGGKIGTYSKKPMYFNPANSKKDFKPAGKPPQNNIVDRKTKYFKKGYYAVRAEIGAENSFVNLHFTGTLQGNFQNKKAAIGYEIGFMSAKKGLIAEGLEEKYGVQIFGISEKDKKDINKIVANFTANLSK